MCLLSMGCALETSEEHILGPSSWGIVPRNPVRSLSLLSDDLGASVASALSIALWQTCCGAALCKLSASLLPFKDGLESSGLSLGWRFWSAVLCKKAEPLPSLM